MEKMKFLELSKLVLTTGLTRELSPPLRENLGEFAIFRGGGVMAPMLILCTLDEQKSEIPKRNS